MRNYFEEPVSSLYWWIAITIKEQKWGRRRYLQGALDVLIMFASNKLAGHAGSSLRSHGSGLDSILATKADLKI